jgi:hypothetical protein
MLVKLRNLEWLLSQFPLDRDLSFRPVMWVDLVAPRVSGYDDNDGFQRADCRLSAFCAFVRGKFVRGNVDHNLRGHGVAGLV